MLIEETIHEEKIPDVDPVVDIYSVIAKFLNSIKYKSPVIFPLSRDKFFEVQTKLHEISTGKPFNYDAKVKEFDATFEGRLFTFIKINNEPTVA